MGNIYENLAYDLPDTKQGGNEKMKRKYTVLTSLFKSHQQDTRTPISIFKELDKEFHFDLDPCTSTSKPGNLGTPHYFLYPEKDGLNENWFGNVFVNPPFKHADKWVKKAYEESLKGCTVVVFVPAKTDTAWWHDYALKAKEIRFIRGRVTFETFDKPFIIGMTLLIFK